MNINVITVEEFIKLKLELIEAVKETISKLNSNQTRAWLRTSDVHKILNISNSSIQNLRNSGILPFSKIHGAIFYKATDVEKLLEENLQKSQR
jgi:hypothetical protein